MEAKPQSSNLDDNLHTSIQSTPLISPPNDRLSTSSSRSDSLSSPPRATRSVDDSSPHFNHRPPAFSKAKRANKGSSPLGSYTIARSDQVASQVCSTRSSSTTSQWNDSISLASTLTAISEPPEFEIYDVGDAIADLALSSPIPENPSFGAPGLFSCDMDFLEEPSSYSIDPYPSLLEPYPSTRDRTILGKHNRGSLSVNTRAVEHVFLFC